MLDAALEALGSFLDPTMFVFLMAGVAAGLVIGIIPGMGGTAAVALLLPFVFLLEPNQAMALLIGAVAVVHTADTIASVLLGIPGSSSAAVLLLDGHPMAKEGKAAKALSIAFLSSIAGGLLGAIGLTLTIPIARPIVLGFGSPELFLLTIIGIAMTAILSQGNLVRGLMAGAFGLVLGQVGAAPAAPDYRFTFGSDALLDGMELVAVALGIFAISEVISSVAKRGAIARSTPAGIGSGWAEGPREVLREWRHVLRGAFVGIWTGVVPGLGASATTWIAYGQMRATASVKDKKKLGKGHRRGVVTPESAVNSGDAGDLIPTLLFGIPGAAPMAILLGALLTFGIEPGPRMLTDNLDTVYTIVWSFVLATVIGAGLAFLVSAPLAKLSFLPFPVIAGGLIVILLVAGFQGTQHLSILWLMLVLGVVGWIMKRTNVPRASFLIGFVLSVPMERYYFLTDRLYDFDEWVTRPGVLAMFGLMLIPAILMVVRRLRAKGATTDNEGEGSRDSVSFTSEAPEEDLESEDSEATPSRAWTMGVAVAFLIIFSGAFVLALDFSPSAQLMPQIVAVVGFVLAAGAVAMETRDMRRQGAKRDDKSWNRELGLVFQVIIWLVALIALVYAVGLLLATLVFLPAFLRKVAGMKWWSISLYTVVLITVLIVLNQVAHITIPIGHFTPEALIL